MKSVPAGAFKAKCLALMDEVKKKRQPILITKHGKPVAKLVPVEDTDDPIFGFAVGHATITGDIIAPALTKEEWGDLY